MSGPTVQLRRPERAAGPLALACLLALAAGSADAASASGTISINLTILSKSNCKFTTAPPTLIDFGVLDLASTTAITQPVPASFKCGGSAASATYSVSASTGQYHNGTTRRMRHTDTVNFLPYAMSLTPFTGTVNRNVEVNLTITPSIAVADFQQAIAGLYSDTITITVEP